MYKGLLFIDVTKFSRLSKLSNIHVHFVDIRAIVDHKLFKLSIYNRHPLCYSYIQSTPVKHLTVIQERKNNMRKK